MSFSQPLLQGPALEAAPPPGPMQSVKNVRAAAESSAQLLFLLVRPGAEGGGLLGAYRFALKRVQGLASQARVLYLPLFPAPGDPWEGQGLCFLGS